MKEIKGPRISLRPSTLEDRRMVYEWSHETDISSFVHLPPCELESYSEFCENWKEYYFTGAKPRSGRIFLIMYENEPIGTLAYNDIDEKNRVEFDIWMNSEANCNRGFGPEAIDSLCRYLEKEYGVVEFMMQPSQRNPRAIRAYEKAGFVRTQATPEEIRREWGGVDHSDSVLMIRKI